MTEAPSSKPSVLIAETHPKHWNTVEPLAEQFLARGFTAGILGPMEFAGLFGSPRFAERGLNFIPYTSRRELGPLFSPGRYDLLLLSPTFLEERPERLKAMRGPKALAVQGFNRSLAAKAAAHTGLVLHLHRIAWAGAGPEPELGRMLNSLRLSVRKRLLAGAKAMLVYDEPIAEELSRRLAGMGYATPVLAAPPAVFRGGEPPAEGPEGRLRVVIPGRIDQIARTYEWAKLIPAGERQGLELWLVGKATSREDLVLLRDLKALGFAQPRGVDGGFVPFALYDSLLDKADLLLAPLRERKDLTPGKDTITGAAVEAVRVGKPLLVPDWYRFGAGLNGVVTAYPGDAGPAGLLVELKNDPVRLLKLRSKAHRRAQSFRAENLDLVPKLSDLTGIA